MSLAVYDAVADHARERGVILADTKFEFGLDEDGELVLGDEVCTPDSSRFWPADEYEPGRGQPSFDKQYVRDWASGTGWDKTPPAPAIPDDVVAATRERYVTAYERLAGEPFSAWLERDAPREGAGPDPAEGGDPRSAGPDRRARAAGARVRGRVATSTSAGWSSSTSRTRRGCREMCERLLANPLIEDYEIVGQLVRFGVVRFPGSCDERRRAAGRRAGRRRRAALARRPRPAAASTPSIVPGGFSYGDYLRVGAIARFSPVMEEVERFARDGGPVLGICNGFQVLCEAGLLPGRAAAEHLAALRLRQVELEVVNAATPWTRACEAGERLSIPAKHTTGRYYAPEPVLDEMEANGQVVAALRAGRRTPTARCATSPASPTRRATSSG